MHAALWLSGLALASATPLFRRQSVVKCPVILDGRVPSNLTLLSFDSAAESPFSPQYVKGENLTWSSIIQLPSNISNARFDPLGVYKPLEVTIDDKSLFHPGGQNVQIGFRRAGLLLKGDANAAGGDKADSGIATFHWSIMQDPARPLNLSHEYMNVWHEKSDYSGNQFTFVGGVVLVVDGGRGVDTPGDRNSWKVQNAKNEFVFQTAILQGAWQNFAVQLDYDKK